MKHLRRFILNSLTVLSLTLCVATVALWVRSTLGPIPLVVDDHRTRTRVWTEHQHGELYVRWREIQPMPDGTWDVTGNFVDATYDEPSRTHLGFGYGRQPTGPAPTGTGQWRRVAGRMVAVQGNTGRYARAGYATIPYALPFLLTGAGPVCWWVARRRRTDRARRGLCHICSYDLTGNISGICPECGMKIEQSTA